MNDRNEHGFSNIDKLKDKAEKAVDKKVGIKGFGKAIKEAWQVKGQEDWPWWRKLISADRWWIIGKTALASNPVGRAVLASKKPIKKLFGKGKK